MIRVLTALLALALPAQADENIADQYPGSVLYQKPVEVIPNVWSAIGATAPPTYENSGHNNKPTELEAKYGGNRPKHLVCLNLRHATMKSGKSPTNR